MAVDGDPCGKRQRHGELARPVSLAGGSSQKRALVGVDDEAMWIPGLDGAGEWQSWPAMVKQGGGQNGSGELLLMALRRDKPTGPCGAAATCADWLDPLQCVVSAVTGGDQ
jgi:hypothetical protein